MFTYEYKLQSMTVEDAIKELGEGVKLRAVVEIDECTVFMASVETREHGTLLMVGKGYCGRWRVYVENIFVTCPMCKLTIYVPFRTAEDEWRHKGCMSTFEKDVI